MVSIYGIVELGYYTPEIVTPFTILGLLTGLFAVIGNVNGMDTKLCYKCL